MDKNKESTAYKRITEILDFSCDLTPYECYYLRGRLSAYAEKIMDAEAIEALQTSKPHRNSNHNPNVTMINCNRKPTE